MLDMAVTDFVASIAAHTKIKSYSCFKIGVKKMFLSKTFKFSTLVSALPNSMYNETFVSYDGISSFTTSLSTFKGSMEASSCEECICFCLIPFRRGSGIFN